MPRYATPQPDQRNCALYRIFVLHPDAGKVVLGYIGETARLPFIRFMEHLYEQPFGDTIVGKPQVDPRVFVGKAAVLAAERAAVEAERPLYNDEWNRGNPDRIPIPVARQQREARDAARGVVSPVWPAARQVAAPTRTARPSRRRSYRWLLSRPVGYVALWLTLAVGGWTAAVREGVAHGWAGPEFGAVGASLLFVFAMSARKPRRRRRRR